MNEMMLYHIWDSGHFKDNIFTESDKLIHVVYPGIYDHDKGPDFKNARIFLNQKMIPCDIEIEMNPENWYHHKHHLNENFQNVQFVVVFENPNSIENLYWNNEKPIDIIVIGKVLDDSILRIMDKEAMKSIQSKTYCPMYSEEIEPLKKLELLGLKKVKEKIERFKIRYGNKKIFDELIYQGIMESLGYSKNKKQFLLLSDMCPYSQIREELIVIHKKSYADFIFSIYLINSGLVKQNHFYKQILKNSDVQKKVTNLYCGEKIHWNLFRIRPKNHPIWRLYYFSAFIASVYPRSLTDIFLQSFYQEDNFIQNWKKILRLKNDTIRSEKWTECIGKNYFNGDYLIGSGRINDIIFNSLLPALWIFFHGENHQEKIDSIIREIKCFPKLQGNFPVDCVLKRFKRKNPPLIITKAIEQMGLLYLYENYCKSGFCEECVL